MNMKTRYVIADCLLAVVLVILAASHGAAAPDGQALYLQYCAACHQVNGKGIPGFFPPLAGNPTVTSDSPEGIESYLRSVIFGYHGALTVKGQLYTGTMPPVGYFANLTDDQLVALINYQRAAWGNAAKPVSVVDLTAIKQPHEMTEGWTSLTKTATGCAVFYNARKTIRVSPNRVRTWMRTSASPACAEPDGEENTPPPGAQSEYAYAYDYIEIDCDEDTFRILETSFATKDGKIIRVLTHAGYDRPIPPDSTTRALQAIVCEKR